VIINDGHITIDNNACNENWTKINNFFKGEGNGRICNRITGLRIITAIRDELNEDDIYLEIGTLNGGSVCLSMLHPKKCHHVCIDPFNGYYIKGGDTKNPEWNILYKDSSSKGSDTVAPVIDNIKKINVHNHTYHLIKNYSTDKNALVETDQYRGKVGLLLIDGDHTRWGAKFDFDNYYELVKPGGYIIFDDYDGHTVTEAVEECLAEYADKIETSTEFESVFVIKLKEN